jgi:chromosome segregation ATPase
MTAVWDKLFGNAPLPANDALLARPPSLSSRDFDELPAKDREPPPRMPQRERAPDPTAATVTKTFDSIGRRNEALRAELDAIEFAFSNIEVVRSHFLGVLKPIDEILGEIERANAKQHDAEAKLDSLALAYEKLRDEANELAVDRKTLSAKQAELSARIGDCDKAMQKASVELTESRAGQAAQAARAERLERELEDSKRRLATVSEQLPGLRIEFVAKEKKLQEVEQHCVDLEDRQKLATQELRSMRGRVEDMVANTSKLNRKINELEGRNGDAARRINELEAALAQEVASHARLKNAQLDDAESHRLALANAQEEINALRARSEGGERLLAEARSELRERNATIRTLEQAAMETSIALQTQEQRQAQMDADVTAARAKQAETETARSRLETRCADLARSLDTKTAALARAEEQAAKLEARIGSEVKLAIAELESRDALIVRLRADLESQSSARAFAEGALQSARQERVSWRNAVDANVAATSESRRLRA